MNKRKKKTSVGIAICRINTDIKKREILLIKNRTTHSFSKFVFGNYKCNNNKEMNNLFNTMTVHEKLLIMNFNFQDLWDHIWLRQQEIKIDHYNRCKNKYDKLNRTIILSMIYKSKSIDLAWEIPKGHPHDGESIIDCGIREIKEETNVLSHDYTIIPEVVVNATYVNRTCIFLYQYLVADYNNITNPLERHPGISLTNKDQVYEIDDLRWFTLDEMQQITFQHTNFITYIRKIFTIHKLHSK